MKPQRKFEKNKNLDHSDLEMKPKLQNPEPKVDPDLKKFPNRFRYCA